MATKTFYVIEDEHNAIKRIYEVMPMIQVVAVGVEKMGTGESVLVPRQSPIFFSTQFDYENYLNQTGANLVETIEKEIP